MSAKKTLQFAVIGDPVLHSLSPYIHNAMLTDLGINGVYTAQEVSAAQLSVWMASPARRSLTGFNATMPHKQTLLKLVDMVDPMAARIGAINTVVDRDGQLHGYNTDGIGFLRSLAELGESVKGRRITMLGSGGAALAIAAALVEAGIERLHICCRHPEQGKVLADMLHGSVNRVFGWESIAEAAENADFLINATSLGMRGLHDFHDTAFLDGVAAEGVVCDVVYFPQQTTLLRMAGRRGLRTADGLGMLVNQAILALEIFLDSPLDIPRMNRVARKALLEHISD